MIEESDLGDIVLGDPLSARPEPIIPGYFGDDNDDNDRIVIDGSVDLRRLISYGNFVRVVITGDIKRIDEKDKRILRIVANNDYKGYPNERVGEVLSVSTRSATTKVNKVNVKLATDDLFTAVCKALHLGLITAEGILEERVSDVADSVRSLSRVQKIITNALYRTASSGEPIDEEKIARTTGYSPATVSKTLGLAGRDNSKKTRIQVNRAQYAVYAHIYATIVRTDVQEILTGDHLDTLNALVETTTNNRHMFSDAAGKLDRNVGSVHANFDTVCKLLGQQSLIGVVCRAVELGALSLLPENNHNGGRPMRALSLILFDEASRSRDIISAPEKEYVRYGVQNEAQLARYVAAAVHGPQNGRSMTQ